MTATAPTAGVAEAPLRPRFSRRWALAVAAALGGVLLFVAAIGWLLFAGIGIWGNNVPYVWGFDLANYVWWIGIANGASLFAAILVLRRHDLRTATNRFAEGAALFAVVCAGLFPILHLGRPLLFYWVFPYPATHGVWPQFRSPLTWDFWAISTHAIVTSLFWYAGLVPDLATLRDRARRRWPKRLYGYAALGWNGSARHWAYHQRAYRLVALTIIPLAFVMQSAVAFEFASTLTPAWHETRQPLHFVMTGFATGLATVLLLAAVLRANLHLRRQIDDSDMILLSKLVLAASFGVAWVYVGEWVLLLHGDPIPRAATVERIAGDFGALHWAAVLLTVGVPQALWVKRWRTSTPVAVLVGLGVATGVWLDRLSIVVGGVARDWLPSVGGDYAATWPEWQLLVGSLALFALLALLFARYLPAVSMYETRHDEHEDATA